MKSFYLTGLAMLFFALTCDAEEAILTFHSDITVSKEGVLDVVEHITVRAEGFHIQRGIFRDFPTQYVGPMLTSKKVPFEIQSITHNGKPSPYHTEHLNNGIRIYIGSGSVYLDRGVHRYQIHYQTAEQLGYFDAHDELYWNVTGNGWAFPIEQASAKVMLPNDGVSQIIKRELWTGYQGEDEQKGSSLIKGGAALFETNEPLAAYQGLTLGISVPKGVFLPPKTNPWDFIADNLAWLMTVGLLLGYLAYFLQAWYRYGRDPEAGTIIPLFGPPKGISPAAARYLDKETIDEVSLTSALVSLASKGFMTIKQSKKQFELRDQHSPKQVSLSRGEKAIRKKLFKGSSQTVRIKKTYHSRVNQAKNTLKSVIKEEYQKQCFVDNWDKIALGWVVSLFATYFFFYTWIGHIYGGFELFLMLLFGGFFIGVGLVLLITSPWLWFIVIMGAIGSYHEAAEWVHNHLPAVLFLVGMISCNLLFAYLLKAPTPFGRQLKDKIEGLKLYIKTAEVDRLNLLHPPKQNLAHYEALLPYAIALGLENEWGARFAKQLELAQSQPGGYHPDWYLGSQFSSGDFSDNMSDFSGRLNGTISTAMTTPSSSGSSGGSSGGFSSGGGFSGGGGGGGGGGGW